MHIYIDTIPHAEQRYPTVGDWFFAAAGGGSAYSTVNSTNSTSIGGLHVKVSDMNNEDYEFCVGIHEQIEAYLCLKRGVTEESVTEFDRQFEEVRLEGNTDEPGDHPDAPYRKEHFFATSIERLVAAELGVDWAEYDKTVFCLVLHLIPNTF